LVAVKAQLVVSLVGERGPMEPDLNGAAKSRAMGAFWQTIGSSWGRADLFVAAKFWRVRHYRERP
jgi:hypothetical protein